MIAGDASGSIVASVGAITNVGSKRLHNEDCFGVSALGGALAVAPSDACPAGVHVVRTVLASGLFLSVFDGAGGASSGELASRDAARVVHGVLAEVPLPPDEDALRDRLVRAIAHANAAVLAAGQSDSNRRGSGTTATVAALVDACAVFAQAGDSRAYLLRGRRLVQMTKDDRLTPEVLRASGKITEEEIASFPNTNVVTKMLGMVEGMEPAITRVVLRRGDALLLCTDGLWKIVGDQTIRAVLLRQRAPGVACRVLCDEALRAGGPDNLAVVVARFDGEGLRPPIRAESL